MRGTGLLVNDKEAEEVTMRKAGLIEEGAELDLTQQLVQYRSGWGHFSSNRLGEIYEKIQQISQWV